MNDQQALFSIRLTDRIAALTPVQIETLKLNLDRYGACLVRHEGHWCLRHLATGARLRLPPNAIVARALSTALVMNAFTASPLHPLN